MDDSISRRAAINTAKTMRDRCDTGDIDDYRDLMVESLMVLPSADPEWELFRLITSVWYGKECYYLQDNGHVYSRVSHRYMHKDEAIDEFLGVIGDNG